MTGKNFEIRCTSCRNNVVSEDRFTQFECPFCGKSRIIRCEKCRKVSAIYKCPDCGFEGP